MERRRELYLKGRTHKCASVPLKTSCTNGHAPNLTPIVVILFGKEFLAERIERDEFSGESSGIDKTLGDQHDLADELKVRHHHGARPEQRLQVLRQLSATGVTGGEGKVVEMVVMVAVKKEKLVKKRERERERERETDRQTDRQTKT